MAYVATNQTELTDADEKQKKTLKKSPRYLLLLHDYSFLEIVHLYLSQKYYFTWK